MKDELYLSETFKKAWAGRDPFAAAFALEGELYRAQQGRETLRFELGGGSWFIKRHRGASLKEIAKNLLTARLPVVSARNEWRALTRLRELGVDSMTPAAYGKRGISPARLQSFLVTQDLGDTESLETICARWPSDPPSPGARRRLIEQVAGIARRLHDSGMCHRDFYLCHFLQDKNEPSRLYLIDLHRALIRRRLARRWIVKDIGSLWFSAMDIGLTGRDLLRFVKAYSDRSLRRSLEEEGAFWRAVERRAFALKRKHG